MSITRPPLTSPSPPLDAQFHIQSAGPLSVPGQYRLRIILYDGFQPVEAGPDLLVGASTGRRPVDLKKGGMVSSLCCVLPFLSYSRILILNF